MCPGFGTGTYTVIPVGSPRRDFLLELRSQIKLVDVCTGCLTGLHVIHESISVATLEDC